jgi:organic hydroperoxide reductase OsmC/OhrA
MRLKIVVDESWFNRSGTMQGSKWASAAPAYMGSDLCVDPEEAFAASLSSCQTLTFLAIAFKKQFTVDGYRAQAVGVVGKDQTGNLPMTRVTPSRPSRGIDARPCPLERGHCCG